ncbi:hypothetical protein [Rickettsia endosymbiont of Rhinocyllus conicus]|uniref:hypothetical protein n=1 Tax=Rickettsia endosymbiont of Rhinocyllus conicus TaxID=3066252 RepID=UPI003133467B
MQFSGPLYFSNDIKQEHNAWLQIVRTDSSDKKLQKFIDTNVELHPFYTLEQDFYDAPYGLIQFFLSL